MAFAKHPKTLKWSLAGHKLEQVKTFKYLGVVFQASTKCQAHLQYVTQNARKSALAIQSYFHQDGAQFVPAALKLFTAKTCSKLLYGSQLGPYTNCTPLEIVQTKFLRSFLQIPRCVPNVILRMETGMPKMEARMWFSILSFWLRLSFFSTGLAHLIFIDKFNSSWKQSISCQISLYGFSLDGLLEMGFCHARLILKERIYDMEMQTDRSLISKEVFLGLQMYNTKPANYLGKITITKYCRMFTLARFNVLPSAELEGKFRGIPKEQRLCPCGSGEQESIFHILLCCLFYRDLRTCYISSLLTDFPGHTDAFYVNYLLSDQKEEVTFKVAKFCEAAKKARQQMVNQIMLTGNC
ncbi:39S ribosomal protein L19, mitochondrial isoform X1 [Hemicordylus capensis]|uniref:39S ribosomal protein L19, mitochondrial isoform X1 n=1 Tax=Hemicordylus capensis TaxID=884348 RepID=UPI0023049776|nr:39S ribosomal protein L19, mitochondrial isoform X1 [Hemicordylus capensis]XP_053139872.1 39S ribosomal protein L19, mitochondrial isoform X1 [Hemicordylus capensis]